MRGKHGLGLQQRRVLRITPAHAGKTLHTPQAESKLTDHPRACGENLGFPSLWIAKQGSPPRMRGKLYALQSRGENRGITPACAGKANEFPDLYLMVQDHSRVCGESASSLRSVCATAGSPPRVRGKLRIVHTVHDRLRITPACAGKAAVPSQYHGEF